MPEDIIPLLISLIEDNWDNSNTLDITPEVTVGHTEGAVGTYSIVIRNLPNEDAVGTSGVYGLGSGGTAVQLNRGLIFIECAADIGDGTQDPDSATDKFAKEIRRILMEFLTSVAGYDYVSFLGVNRIPPQNKDHPFRIIRSCRIGYQWRYHGS